MPTNTTLATLVDSLTAEERVALVRSFGFWVRGPCDGSSPVRFIVVDPQGDEDGLMLAGGDEVLELALDYVDEYVAERVARRLVARRGEPVQTILEQSAREEAERAAEDESLAPAYAPGAGYDATIGRGGS